jgi:serine/threonine-protein kinase
MKTCPTCQVSYPTNYAICPADGSPLDEIGTWSDGSIIRGKYRLLAKVGQGGMGSVYKALHLAFDEMRALKVIAPELLTDDLFVKRFKHEAVITRKLQHPNAVRVDDIDEAEDGRPFIVMEFIEGKSLKKLIREEGPLPAQRVCLIIKQCAYALEAAHKLGMVHRDIKPDNIALVDAPEGEMVKVLDFGIAKVKEARMGEGMGLTLTGAGVVIGTPQYMSPEQAMGKRGDELDGRADLYSLGVVMYQMLTADLPFKADTTMEMLLAHMQKAPSPIGVLHPELQVPEGIAALTMRMLEKNRDLRPASARALIQEIERIEKDLLNPGRTRVLTADDLIGASDGRGSAGGDRGAQGVVPPVRPQAPPPRPLEPPKPAQPVRPAMPALPPLPPTPRAAPPESRWGMYAAIVVLLVGLGGGGLWFATRPSASTVPAAGDVTATLKAEPSTIQKGESVTLRWTSQNADDLDLEPEVGHLKEASGYRSVTPVESTQYTLIAVGSSGTQSRTTADVTVTTAASPPPPPAPTPQTTEQTPEPTPPPAPSKPKPTRRPAAPEPVTPPTPKVDAKAVQGKITLGNYYYKNGQYDDAIGQYQQGLNIDPSNAELRQKLEQTINACKKERSILGEDFKCGGH